MTSPLLRVGLIGYGYWGPNILRNFAATEGATPAMLCDLDPSRLAKAEQRFPGLQTTTDVDALISNPEIDAVAIVTPVSTHFPLAKKALENGKHVLVEKPLTATVAEAEALVALAEERNLRLMVDHTFLYHGPVLTVKALIDKGELGDVLYYDSTRINLGLFQTDVSVVWDLASHDFSIMDYLIGKDPKVVTAVGTSFNDTQVSIAYVMVRFEDESLAHFHLNWLSPVKVRRLIIGGTKKMVVSDHASPEESVKVYDSGVDFIESEGVHKTLVQYRIGDMYAPRVANTEPLSLLCKEFVAAIAEGRAPMTDGKAGLRVVRLLEAAQQSLDQGGVAIEL